MSVGYDFRVQNKMPGGDAAIGYESTMTTMERYQAAVKDELGMVNTKIALNLLKADPNLCAKNPGIWEEFFDQARAFLETRSRFAQGVEKARLESIVKVLRAQDTTKASIESALSEVNVLDNETTGYIQKARDAYHKTLRHY